MEAAITVGEVAGWVRRARAGDEEAFALLVERYERMVLRTSFRILGRLDVAQDAAQEAFLRLHRYLARFDESRELGPWLYRVVVNVCRNELSRLAHSPRILPLDDAGDLTSPSDTAGSLEDEMARGEQRRLVRAALLTLSPREREAIVLRDLEGLDTAEVSRILGSTETTVRSQISKGRLKIKRYVETHRGTR